MRRRYLLPAAIALSVLAVLAAYSCRRPARDLSSPAGLLAALEDAGLEYEARTFAPGSPSTEPGLYLRRAGDARPWAELASQEHVAHPERWKGYVRLRPCPTTAEATAAPHCRRFGGVLVVGDPVEIARIAQALR